MTRLELIQRLRRQIYGGFPTDDASITDNLINLWINDGCGIAAKQNYKENLQLDGVAYVSNSFYSTFKGIAIAEDENDLYKFTLPQIPLGLGATEGISRIIFKDILNNLSYPAVILSQNQVSVQRGMRPIPNKILCYPEGGFAYAITSILMNNYTASVTMISGGNSTDLNSVLNIPNDYINIIVEYVKAQLAFERMQPVDVVNDGSDVVKVA